MLVGIEIATGIPDDLLDKVVSECTQIESKEDLLELGVNECMVGVFFDIIMNSCKQ